MKSTTLIPERKVSKTRKESYTASYFFSYDRKKITSHLDSRKLIRSDFPGSTDRCVDEIFTEGRR